MTDNEIIKALECCAINLISNCKECPLRLEDGTVQPFCTTTLLGNALGFINRQKAEIKVLQDLMVKYNGNFAKQEAEIERLREEIKEHIKKGVAKRKYDIALIKAEAYKEFAEKSEKEIFIKQDNERKQMLEILKTYRGTRTYSDTERATDNWLRGYGEAVQDILSINDNLLKEMVGENDVNEKAKE